MSRRDDDLLTITVRVVASQNIDFHDEWTILIGTGAVGIQSKRIIRDMSSRFTMAMLIF